MAHSRHRSRVAGHWTLCLSLLLLALGAGCRVVQTTAELPGRVVSTVTPAKKDPLAVDPVELQETLLRFADDFFVRVNLGVNSLRFGTNAQSDVEVLKWKTGLGTEICSIASGPNTVANLLDMTVFVTVTRMVLEHHWQPTVFGDSAGPLLQHCRSAETEIWQITGRLLNSEQQAELRQAIEVWRRENPLPASALGARAVGFAADVAKVNKAATTKPGSVFSLLQLDPLAGLDPATREIAQARLFAERALFVTQKMPTLLRWQTELLSLNTIAQPAVQQLITNSTQLAASVERFAAVAEALPGQLSSERQAILKSLQSQEEELARLAGEVRQTLLAGSQMSSSLNTTLTTFDALMERFGVGDTNATPAADTNTEPFRIKDYEQTAAQLEATARQLTELLVTMDRTIGSTNLAAFSAQVAPVVQQAQASGREIVDYAFWKAVVLVVIMLVAAVVYRLLSVRMNASLSKRDLP